MESAQEGRIDRGVYCGYRWWSSSCLEWTPDADYRRGGAICAVGFACFNGVAAVDAAPYCPEGGTRWDMSIPPDATFD